MKEKKNLCRPFATGFGRKLVRTEVGWVAVRYVRPLRHCRRAPSEGRLISMWNASPNARSSRCRMEALE
jgi:hypothetical protein